MSVRSIKLVLILMVATLVTGCEKSFKGVDKEIPLAITVNIKDMSLSFIDLQKESVLQNWQLDQPFIGGMILPDGDTIALYGKQANSVDLFSIEAGKKIASWPTGSGIASGIVLKEKQEVVFADQERDSIRFFDLNGKQLKEIKMNADPLTLIESSDTHQLFVISYYTNTLTVVNTSERAKIKDVLIHPSAQGAMLLESKDEIWIGGHGEGTDLESNIHIYNYVTGDLKTTVAAPFMPVRLLELNGYIYCLSHGSSTLYQLSTTGERIKSLKVGANPFEIADGGDELLVAGYDSDDIHFVSTKSMTIQNHIQVGKGPFQILIRETNDGTKIERTHR